MSEMTRAGSEVNIQLTRFRDLVSAARRQAGFLQKDLAAALGLDIYTLSRKLHGSNQACLTSYESKQIIKILASWGAITTKVEAIELLALRGLKPGSFSQDEWNHEPLSRLEQAINASPVAYPLPTANTIMPSAQRAHALLPSPPTSFIGREGLVQSVCEQLRLPGVRLLTLLGPGGVGKTRLSLEVANQLQDDFADGVYFVSLSDTRDHNLLPLAIARALNILTDAPHLHQLSTREQSLRAFLANKRLLLVLDNFEQLRESAVFVSTLLEGAAQLKILVTSRAVLRIYGEHEINVPPLEVADPENLPDLSTLACTPAVRLFIERARAVQSRFTLNAANARVVAEICAHLEGFPLSIELAALRIKLFDPSALFERLSSGGKQQQRLSFLRQSLRNVPVRQRTLWNTLDWSYQILEIEQRHLFICLGVFQGGWTLEAALAICVPEESRKNPVEQASDSLLDRLERLIDHCLVVRIPNEESLPGNRRQHRFFLRETIRAYALFRLQKSKDEERVHLRHLDYYLDEVEHAAADLAHDSTRQKAMQELEREQSNIQAALQWAIEHHFIEKSRRLCKAISLLQETHNQCGEVHRWMETALHLKVKQSLPL